MNLKHVYLLRWRYKGERRWHLSFDAGHFKTLATARDVALVMTLRSGCIYQPVRYTRS